MISDDSNKKLKLSSSSHFIYESTNERNKKRFCQFSKRKSVLSLDNKFKENNKFNYKKYNSDKNKNSIDIINVFNLIINRYTEKSREKPKIKNNNFNQDDVLLKEKNIINFNEEKDVLIENIQNNQSYIDYNNDLMNKNEFALNYLTPYKKSFIKLGNNLTTKVKMQNNNFTDSYILALGLDEQKNIKDKYKILQNIDIIKEEKEKEKFITLNKRQKKLKRKKLNLSLEKKEQNKNNINSPKKSLLLINNYYKPNYDNKNRKIKIIKLNIANYNKNYAKINIERRRKNEEIIKSKENT